LNWIFIRDKKPSAIAAAVPAVVAFAVAMTVVVTVGVFLTAAGCALATMRRKSRRKHSLSNLYTFPEGYGDFNSHSPNLKTGTAN
jgi:hypothetical protein